MRTLNISISEIEYSKFSIKNDSLTFTDFIEIVSKEQMPGVGRQIRAFENDNGGNNK